MNITEHITINEGIMGGQMCFGGTRITLEMFVKHLMAGRTVDEFCYSYPTVSKEVAETVRNDLICEGYRVFRAYAHT